MKNQYLVQLRELGQSVWYDNLSRDVLNTGELKNLIDGGVLGLTSNPSIFKKSIADSTDYDSAIKALLQKGISKSDAVCDELMIEDVANAADLLRGIYDSSNAHDGYTSIEVSPFLAHDTQGTIDAGRTLWKRLNRPNIMIKVPATEAGIPAIKTLLSEGINVNITLIFSVKVYSQVVAAYLEALEERAAKGLPIDKISSVASFFVSRVDAICEAKMDDLIAKGSWQAEKKAEFFGKIGIANSKNAYAHYLDIFEGARFKALAAKGAMVQRPLWASTGTKNPVFKAVMYVEELAGRDTVNTMPPATLTALMKEAVIEPRLHQGLSEAAALIDNVVKAGVPFEDLMVELQKQGVKLFADAFTELLDSVTKKVSALQ